MMKCRLPSAKEAAVALAICISIFMIFVSNKKFKNLHFTNFQLICYIILVLRCFSQSTQKSSEGIIKMLL